MKTAAGEQHLTKGWKRLVDRLRFVDSLLRMKKLSFSSFALRPIQITGGVL
jgi:hypothetical protein